MSTEGYIHLIEFKNEFLETSILLGFLIAVDYHLCADAKIEGIPEDPDKAGS